MSWSLYDILSRYFACRIQKGIHEKKRRNLRDWAYRALGSQSKLDTAAFYFQNPFHAQFSFYIPWKQKTRDVFKGYEKSPVAWNGLSGPGLCEWFHALGSNSMHRTIIRTGITCKKIPCYMRNSVCRWFIV